MCRIMTPSHIGIGDGFQLWFKKLLSSLSAVTASAVINTTVRAKK